MTKSGFKNPCLYNISNQATNQPTNLHIEMYLITNLENHPCFGLDDPPSPKFPQCHRFRPTQRWFHQRCYRPPVRSVRFSIMGMLRWKFECPNFETKKTHVRHKKSVSKTSPPEIWDDIYMFITPVSYHWRPLDAMHNETGDAQPVRPATWTPKRFSGLFGEMVYGWKGMNSKNRNSTCPTCPTCQKQIQLVGGFNPSENY